MYKAIKTFADIMNNLHEYRAGDNYAEVNEKWTAYLAERKLIEKVRYEKKYEAVSKE